MVDLDLNNIETINGPQKRLIVTIPKEFFYPRFLKIKNNLEKKYSMNKIDLNKEFKDKTEDCVYEIFFKISEKLETNYQLLMFGIPILEDFNYDVANGLKFTLSFNLAPDFTLGDYKSLKIRIDTREVKSLEEIIQLTYQKIFEKYNYKLRKSHHPIISKPEQITLKIAQLLKFKTIQDLKEYIYQEAQYEYKNLLFKKYYSNFIEIMSSLLPYELNENSAENFYDLSVKNGYTRKLNPTIDEDKWKKGLFHYTSSLIICKKIALAEGISISKNELEEEKTRIYNDLGEKLNQKNPKSLTIFALQNLIFYKIYGFLIDNGIFEDCSSNIISGAEKDKSSEFFLDKELEI